MLNVFFCVHYMYNIYVYLRPIINNIGVKYCLWFVKAPIKVGMAKTKQPVTQDHFYSINSTQNDDILLYCAITMKHAIPYTIQGNLTKHTDYFVFLFVPLDSQSHEFAGKSGLLTYYNGQICHK